MKSLVNYCYELYQLKFLKRNGWQRAYITDQESIAEHILLATHIGYVLADMEGADQAKVVEMLIFHENGETRIGDVDKLMARYDDSKEQREIAALQEQLTGLPEHLAKRILANHHEMGEKLTLEAQVAKDADYLECAFQANIYWKRGNPWTKDWIKNVDMVLRTESAKKMYEEMNNTDPYNWMQGLKKIPKI